MSKLMNEVERQERLYCTPPHIVKALLKREPFAGTIWEPAAGKGHIVTVLTQCGYTDVLASDLNDWGLPHCEIGDFLVSTKEADCIITNPPFDLKAEFLVRAKVLARRKIAMLLRVDFECSMAFLKAHATDRRFPLKAVYSFPQAIPWVNIPKSGGKMHVAWFVFERGYRGNVIRKPIIFRKNPAWAKIRKPSSKQAGTIGGY